MSRASSRAGDADTLQGPLMSTGGSPLDLWQMFANALISLLYIRNIKAIAQPYNLPIYFVKVIFLSMHLLHRMNYNLDVICMGSVELQGTQN